MLPSKQPTIKDVAQKAGVSLGTASKVINGIPVSERNQKKVLQAIDELGYKVNTYARGLKKNKTGLIALIIPNLTNPFFASFATYVEAALYAENLKLLLCCANGIPQKELECLHMAAQNKVDGVIALTYSDIGQHIPSDLPIVVFDRFFENRNIPRIGSDNFSGACMAVEKLLELGCQHPVYIRFHSVFPGESDKRKDGYLHACQTHQLTPDYLDKVDSQNNIADMKEFLDQHKNPDGSLTFDGVFAHTDYHGYLFCELLRSEGYRVPEDVQLIGFDGITKFGNVREGLFVSSICQPIQELAKTSVELLLKWETDQLPSLTLLPVSYQYGGTTIR